jgi:hypothetical protein
MSIGGACFPDQSQSLWVVRRRKGIGPWTSLGTFLHLFPWKRNYATRAFGTTVRICLSLQLRNVRNYLPVATLMLRIISREKFGRDWKSETRTPEFTTAFGTLYYFHIPKFTIICPKLPSSLCDLPRIFSPKHPPQPGAPQNWPTIYLNETPKEILNLPSISVLRQLSCK